ncbi:MAG TPA: hypothetical protein VHS03_15865 [Gaiellaceae bacterium]|nr:hypothetical protein [Gaiellaceae bacterium]
MDADRITQLRSWAQGLEEKGSNEETRAAGKAILMLVGEVESLQAKLAAAAAAAAPAPASAPTEPAEPAADETASWDQADDRLSGSFWSRLKRTFGFDS